MSRTTINAINQLRFDRVAGGGVSVARCGGASRCGGGVCPVGATVFEAGLAPSTIGDSTAVMSVAMGGGGCDSAPIEARMASTSARVR